MFDVFQRRKSSVSCAANASVSVRRSSYGTMVDNHGLQRKQRSPSKPEAMVVLQEDEERIVPLEEEQSGVRFDEEDGPEGEDESRARLDEILRTLAFKQLVKPADWRVRSTRTLPITPNNRILIIFQRLAYNWGFLDAEINAIERHCK